MTARRCRHRIQFPQAAPACSAQSAMVPGARNLGAQTINSVTATGTRVTERFPRSAGMRHHGVRRTGTRPWKVRLRSNRTMGFDRHGTHEHTGGRTRSIALHSSVVTQSKRGRCRANRWTGSGRRPSGKRMRRAKADLSWRFRRGSDGPVSTGGSRTSVGISASAIAYRFRRPVRLEFHRRLNKARRLLVQRAGMRPKLPGDGGNGRGDRSSVPAC